MTYIDTRSLAGRALAMVAEAQVQGRLSEAEGRIVSDVLWHPDLPEFFKRIESLPLVSRIGADAGDVPEDQPITTYRT